MLDLTKTYAKVYNQKRKLFYGNNVSLKCLSINNVLVELFDNWYLDTRTITNLANGDEELYLEIADVNNNLDLNLSVANTFEVNGLRYRKLQMEAPIAGTKIWRFRVAPTGEKR